MDYFKSIISNDKPKKVKIPRYTEQEFEFSDDEEEFLEIEKLPITENWLSKKRWRFEIRNILENIRQRYKEEMELFEAWEEMNNPRSVNTFWVCGCILRKCHNLKWKKSKHMFFHNFNDFGFWDILILNSVVIRKFSFLQCT